MYNGTGWQQHRNQTNPPPTLRESINDISLTIQRDTFQLKTTFSLISLGPLKTEFLKCWNVLKNTEIIVSLIESATNKQ